MAKAIAVADEKQISTGPKLQWERLTSFLQDVRNEMRKVITPTRAETQSNTIIVLACVFVFAAYFWIVDTVLGRAIELLLAKLTSH